MLGALLVLAQLAVTASATDTVALDGVAEVRLSVSARADTPPVVTPPSFRPFLVIRSEVAQRMDVDGSGSVRLLSEYRYTLAPTRAGSYLVPGFLVRAGNAVARSATLAIVVRGGAAARAREPAIIARADLDRGDAVGFRALVLPDTVYVGEQATYQLGVFLDPSVRDRIRRMEAVAPEMRGVMSYEPSAPMEVYDSRTPNGRRFEAHVYERAIFPITPGRIVIPAARLTYALPLSFSFFSREESYEMRSDSVVLIAVEPPAGGRPPEYIGAVGRLSLDLSLDTASVRVGDPVAVRLRVAGEGNVKLWPRPALAVPWGSAVPSGDDVRIASDTGVVRGSKEFEWLVTPQRAGDLVLPSIRYAFWDPVARRYETAATPPETLSVTPGALALAEGDSAARASRLPIRTVYRGALDAPVQNGRAFWIALSLVPLPALALGVARRPARRRRRSRAAELRRLARAPSLPRPRELRRAFVAALAERLGLAAGAAYGRPELVHAARLAGASSGALAELDALLSLLDARAFGTGGADAPIAPRALALYRALDREMCRATPPRGTLAIALLLAATAATIVAAAPEPSDAAVDFARGVRSYQQGEFGAAARLFERVANADPRAPDAWANLGTAAWAASDTARAVVGWQRALRLEPLARDVRPRLALAAADDGAAGVLPLPPDALALLAAAVWVVAWGYAAARAARGRRPALWGVGAGLAAALALAAGARAQERRLEARDLAVAASAGALHISPTLAADAIGTARSGEVLRVAGRAGGWTRVATDDGIEGWLPAGGLLSLARD